MTKGEQRAKIVMGVYEYGDGHPRANKPRIVWLLVVRKPPLHRILAYLYGDTSRYIVLKEFDEEEEAEKYMNKYNDKIGYLRRYIEDI